MIVNLAGYLILLATALLVLWRASVSGPVNRGPRRQDPGGHPGIDRASLTAGAVRPGRAGRLLAAGCLPATESYEGPAAECCPAPSGRARKDTA